MIHTLTIRKTTDYSDFRTVKGNRLINKDHLSRLKKSVQQKNLLNLNPIIVNENMQIIDGQHRLEVCRSLGLPVYYVVGRGLDFEDVVLLNSNTKDWSLVDYLESYCEQGYQDYKVVKHFAKQYELSPSNAIAILSMGEHVQKAGYQAFKQGNFEVVDLNKSIEFAVKLKQVARYCTKNTWRDRDFIRALSLAYEAGVEHDILMDKIERSKGLIMRQGNVTEYLRAIEDIYNLNSQNRVRLY